MSRDLQGSKGIWRDFLGDLSGFKGFQEILKVLERFKGFKVFLGILRDFKGIKIFEVQRI